MALQQKQRNISLPLSRPHDKKCFVSIRSIFIVFVLCHVALLSFLWKGIQISTKTQTQNIPSEMHLRMAKPDGKQQGVDAAATTKDDDDEYQAEMITLKTQYGPISIILRGDLSDESVRYVHKVFKSNTCDACHFYRAENDRGILQGKLKSKSVPSNTALGECPVEKQMEIHESIEKKEKQDCPPHDPYCNCHGPFMWKGAVAWAGGKSGPDFFIDNYKKEATWWGNQHTVWGMIMDDESFGVIEKIFELPKTKKGGMTFLDEKVDFTLEDTKFDVWKIPKK